jgi:hypothetical protein
MRRIAPVLTLLVLAASPATATAAARLVSPTGGRIVGTFPQLRWTLPSGEQNEVVYVARQATRAATGEFDTASLEDTAPVSGRVGSHRMTNGLYAGTHYWMVATRTTDFEQRYSKVGRFRVATSLSVTRVRVTPGPTTGVSDVRMRVKTNRRSLRFTIQVVQGGRVVQTVFSNARVLSPGDWASRNLRWVPSAAVTTGKRATLRVTIKAGSRTARAALDVIAP